MTFDQLLAHYGTQKKAAAALAAFGDGKGGNGLAQSSISEWGERGIPPARQAQYEILTKGKLKADRPKKLAA